MKPRAGEPAEVCESYKKDFENNSVVDGFFHAPTKSERFSEIPSYRKLGISSFKLTWGEREAGGDARLYEAMEKLSELGDGVRGIIHAENKEIGALLAGRLASQGRKDFPAWNQARPWFCEAEFMEKSLLFAGATRCPIYIEHVTIGQGIEILMRAKNKGIDVKAETCPQYLILNSDDKGVLAMIPPLGHVNPPLRDKESNDLLWEGLATGVIDCMGSDHSPYTIKGKGENLWEAPPGLGNTVEMTLPVLISEGVNKGRISVEKFVEVCCANPAKIFGVYPQKGSIAVGGDADLAILDDDERRKVAPEKLHSLCDWSAFEGWELKGWPWATYVRGQLIAQQGEIVGRSGSGKWLRR
jgi:dihydroorotase-like cyclic amidohydrolase